MSIGEASIGEAAIAAPRKINEPVSKYRNSQLITGPVTLSFDSSDGLLITGLSQADEGIIYTEDPLLQELIKRLAEGEEVRQIGTSQDSGKLFEPAGVFANMVKDLRDKASVDRLTQGRELMILRPDFHSDLFTKLQAPLPRPIQQYKSLWLFELNEIELWWTNLKQKYRVFSQISDFFISTSSLYEFPDKSRTLETDNLRQHQSKTAEILIRTMAFEYAAQLSIQNTQREGDRLLADKASELAETYKELVAANLEIDKLNAQVAALEKELAIWWRKVFATAIKASGKWAGASLGTKAWESLQDSNFLGEQGKQVAQAFQAMVELVQ